MAEIIPQFPHVIDNSILGYFKSCHRKGYWGHIMNRTMEGISPHLHAGGAIAKGLEVARIAHWGPVRAEPDAALRAGFRALTRAYGPYTPPDEGTASNKSWHACMYALDTYFAKYGWDTDPVQPLMLANGFPAVEFRAAEPINDVTHPVTGEPLIYACRFDMFGISREYGGALYMVDEKTTTGIGPTWSRQWDLRSQFLGYAWAARRNDYPVVGAIVRGIGMLMRETKQVQAVIQIPRWKIDQWYELTCLHLDRMVAAWKAGYWLQQFDDACNSFGGCEFAPLCNTNNPAAWLGDYTERTWDPLAQDPSKSAERITAEGLPVSGHRFAEWGEPA